MTYLGEMLLSIHEDNVPIAGAFSWGLFLSLIVMQYLVTCLIAMVDNTEWASGLSTRYVDLHMILFKNITPGCAGLGSNT